MKTTNCPNCGGHKIIKNGFYKRKRNRRKVQRYQCASCKHNFSDQTFDKTYRQKRPDLLEKVMRDISNGVGIRRSASQQRTTVTTIQRKINFLYKICESFHTKHLSYWKRTTKPRFQFDEMWSIEKDRWQALTIPVAVELESYFIVSARATYDHCKSSSSSKKDFYNGRVKDELNEQEKILKRCVKKCRNMKPDGRIVIDTDKDVTYGKIIEEVIGDSLVHNKFLSDKITGEKNLLPVNNTMACLRAEVPMLRRESWYITKNKNWLNKHLSIYIFYYNYIRKKRYTVERILNPITGKIKKKFSSKTPAQHLEIMKDVLSIKYLLAHC